jgi:ankyrin repeat protein
MTPIMFAAMFGRTRVVEQLKAHGASLKRRNRLGISARRSLATRISGASLLANKADVNTIGRDKTIGGLDGATGISLGGMTLGWAAQRNDFAMVELLLTNEAAVNARNGLGQTPLSWAVRGGKHMVCLLLANGADANAKNKDGCIPLHWAARDGGKEAAELLLAHKAAVSAGNRNGDTPLHFAAANRFLPEMVELLLVHGAEVNARHNGDETPPQRATSFGNLKQYIRHAGHDVQANFGAW